jgi:hypothetical protein
MNDQAVFARSSHARAGVQHRREQRGAASEAVSADGRVAGKPMGEERNSRLKDEQGGIVLIDNSPLAPRTSPDLNPIDPSASSGDAFEIEDAPAKGFRTIHRSPLEPHRRELSRASQSKRNCSPTRAGGRNKSQRKGTRLRPSPSRAAAASNLRPIIQA